MALKDFIKERPAVSKKWAEVKDIMSYHLMGTPPIRLFRSRRPLESTSDYALAYRSDNHQAITKQPFKTAVASIIETANHIHIQEEGVDSNTQTYLDETKIKAAGRKYTIKDYVVKYIGRMVEIDPNAVLAVIPVHPEQELIPDFREDLPDFDTVQNQLVGISIQLVNSNRIHTVTDEELWYDAGDYVYGIDIQGNKTVELIKPYYYLLTADMTRLVIPFKTDDGFDYKIVDYYPNELEDVPFDIIGHNPILEEIEDIWEEYHESTYAGAVAIGNEVLGVKSDSQVVDTRFTYPEKYMQMERCGHPQCIECVDPDSIYKGLFVNYDTDATDGTCSPCNKCGGTGMVAPDTSPMGTHFVAKADVWSDDGKFTPLIGFVTPPLESPEYLDGKYRRDLEDMKAALFLVKQNITNQSEGSKRLDWKERVTVITGAVDNIYDIYKGLINTIQGYYMGPQDIDILLPPDLNIKTSEEITAELNDAQGTSSLYTAELTRELLIKKLGNSENSRRAISFLEFNDRFFGMTIDEILKLSAAYGKDLTIRDQTIHDKGLVVLNKIAQETDLSTLSDEELKKRFNAEIDIILGQDPEEEQISDDPFLQLEAEARSKLKGTVGGVQGIIAINQAVSDNKMTEDAAEALLQEIYGFDKATADRLIQVVQAGVTVPPSPIV